jgi:hypothetical protein
MDWRPDAQLALGLTPRGGHRQKQQNTMATPPHATANTQHCAAQPIPQPSFSPARMARGRPAGRPRGAGRGRGVARSVIAVNDGDFFAPTSSSSVAPRMISTRSTSIPQLSPMPMQTATFHHDPQAFVPQLPPTQNAPYVAYYYPPYHPQASSHYPHMYSMHMLPPRYYPTAPNNENENK